MFLNLNSPNCNRKNKFFLGCCHIHMFLLQYLIFNFSLKTCRQLNLPSGSHHWSSIKKLPENQKTKHNKKNVIPHLMLAKLLHEINSLNSLMWKLHFLMVILENKYSWGNYIAQDLCGFKQFPLALLYERIGIHMLHFGFFF
jgi:hypothetical protein